MRVEEVEVVLVGDKTTCLRLSLSTIESRMGLDVLIKVAQEKEGLGERWC